MKSKSLILIFIALGCGLVASIGISQVMGRSSEKPEPVAQEKVKILVAARNLTFSSELTGDAVRLEDWPQELVTEEHITEIDEVAGLYPKDRLPEGAPILRSDVGKEDKKPIPPGYRLIPAKVDSETLTAQTRPGDFVDIKVVLKPTGNITTPTVMTVLKRVEIYEVNNDTTREVGEDGKANTLKTISFLVEKEHTNLVTLAKEMGKLRLLLRPAGEPVDETDESQDSLSFGDFLNQQSQEGAKTSADAFASKDEPKEDFGKFVEKNDEPVIVAPTISKPAYEMLVRGPDAAVRYVWHDLDKMPEVQPVGSVAPSASTSAGSQVGTDQAQATESGDKDETSATGSDDNDSDDNFKLDN